MIVPALLAILLLAAGVCALHGHNAVSLRGTVQVSGYSLTDGAAEGLVPIVHDPWEDNGVLYISGALLRPGQQVGAVNVRAALLPQALIEGEPAKTQETAILLNTQMVRRTELAQQYGCDDHCGFYAAVQTDRLPEGTYQYRVMLADETDNGKRMIDTGLTVTPIEGGLAFARANPPEVEAQGDE